MPRADVDIFFSTNKPAFAYIDGAEAVADGSAVAADDGAGVVGVNANLVGASIEATTSDVIGQLAILPIPLLSISVGGFVDMSQYIDDPLALRTGSDITGIGGTLSYDSGTERLTRISSGTEAGLQLEVYY